MNAIKRWLRASSAKEQRQLARLARTSVGQLKQIAGGYRRASASLAIRLERAAGKLNNSKLPPLLREQMALSCRRCDFARKCRGQ